MNRKIKNYIDVMFENMPMTNKAVELREELLANLNDAYEDNIKAGMKENEAYGQAISDMGDIDELLNGIRPSKELNDEVDRYRRKTALMTAIAVMLYILGVVVLIASTIFAYDPVMGLILMLVMVAIATAILIYSRMSAPSEIRNVMRSEDQDDYPATRKGRMYRSINSLFWTFTTIIYLIYSFLTGSWHISWIIWLIASAISRIIHIFYEMGGDDYE